ncbi:MAG: MTH1187 family thiamine-binding protein [Methanomassiliicoccales archaeon]|nr:MTH1187 family thiamine-binding protein [Methanomassiliicoccales archaeon]
MIAQFKVVPVGSGESLSKYVAECVKIVDRSGLKYELTSMSTIVEGELDEVLEVVKACHVRVREMSDRVVTNIEIDDRKGANDEMHRKVQSVERKLKAKTR